RNERRIPPTLRAPKSKSVLGYRWSWVLARPRTQTSGEEVRPSALKPFPTNADHRVSDLNQIQETNPFGRSQHRARATRGQSRQILRQHRLLLAVLLGCR
ncbi:unnamed protein product, partial [Laminaria digitata]